MDSQAQETIRSFLFDNFSYRLDGVELDDAESLSGAGVLDSIGVLSLVTFVEEAFAVSIADDEVTPENLDSIVSLTAFIGRKRNENRMGG